jgi:hypothetical protein
MGRYQNFWTATDIPTFRVPYKLIGDYDETGLLKEMSHPALRLYLTVLCKCSRENKPIVKMTSDYVERHAGISEKHIGKYREELSDLDIVHAKKQRGAWLYELRDPIRQWAIELAPVPDEKVFTGRDGSLKLTPDEVRKVFDHYLGHQFVRDDANGSQYQCPFHTRIGRAKRAHISVSTERGGLWSCQWSKCRKHGKREQRPGTFNENRVMELSEELGYDGGGNTLDFIAAMTEQDTGKIINRQGAAGILQGILSGSIRSSRRPQYTLPDDESPLQEGESLVSEI